MEVMSVKEKRRWLIEFALVSLVPIALIWLFLSPVKQHFTGVYLIRVYLTGA